MATTHDQIVSQLMNRPGVRLEVEKIVKEEGIFLDALLLARLEAGLAQDEVAEKVVTQAPAASG